MANSKLLYFLGLFLLAGLLSGLFGGKQPQLAIAQQTDDESITEPSDSPSPDSPPSDKDLSDICFVYSVLGPIDARKMNKMMAMLDKVFNLGCRVFIIEFDTPGGELQAAMDGADFLFELGHSRGAETIAYVPSGREAYSAGTLLAFACEDLVMGENSSIGDVQPVVFGFTGKPEPLGEKVESALRAKMVYFARKHGYSPAIAEGMVSESTEVRLIQHPTKTIDGDKVVTSSQLADFSDMHGEDALLALRARLISEVGRVLTLTEDDAKLYGVSDETVGSLEELALHYGIVNQIQDQMDLNLGDVHRPIISGENAFFRFINNRFIKFLLVMIGVLLIVAEFTMPSIIGGVVGLASFALFFLGGYAEGNVSWIELLLFVIAGVLVGVEIFVLPGFGVAGIAGMSCLVASLVLAMQPAASFTMGQFVSDSVLIVSSMSLGAISVMILLSILPVKKGQGGLVISTVLNAPSAQPGVFHESGSFDYLLGLTGLAKTDLRPSGKMKIDENLHDVVADCSFIEAGRTIQVVTVEGNRIVVSTHIQNDSLPTTAEDDGHPAEGGDNVA